MGFWFNCEVKVKFNAEDYEDAVEKFGKLLKVSIGGTKKPSISNGCVMPSMSTMPTGIRKYTSASMVDMTMFTTTIKEAL